MVNIENNLSRGSVLTKLVRFALPFLASNVVQSFYNVADMLIVGNFSGMVSMSGVNIGGQVTFILTNMVIGLASGATVLIGQYVGAGNREGLKKVTTTIITLLVMLGFAITAIMLVFKGTVLTLIRTPAESYAESERYLTVTVTGIIFIFGYNALSAILRGMGNSKQPFYFVLAACITNVILDIIFVAVFNWAAAGAAIATVISQAMSVFLCINYMIKNKFQFDFKLKSFKIYKKELALIFKIGIPTCAQNTVTSVSFLFLTAIVNTIGGVSASAAVGAVGKFNSFVFMPTMAMSASISAMSAQNIGAKRLDRAVQTCRIGTAISVCITYTLFILVQLFPSAILSLFGDDPVMIQNGITYLRSFSFDFLIIPFVFCINGFLIGGGHTMFTLMSSILSSLLLRIPVCYLLGVSAGMGLRGVGLGAPVASLGTMIITIIFLMSGAWKHNVVKHNPN
ncbi:MAG: MATE family efflux transporter [Spirochaetaceae bacterium]|jgi:putative MATE family efflux protein|nr:MATE family efflux transporter [Spirochaetaceae bacterium]